MHRRYLAALLILSGFCGLSYELIWVRMLSLSFGSTTLSFSTVIAVFLGGLALGSWLCGRSPRALASPVKTYAYLELATGVIGLLLYPVLRALPELFSHVDPGPGAGGLLMRLFVAILVLLPPTLLMGATLPVACAACIHDDAKLGSGTATLYGINTLGACLGTYGVTFQLFPTVGLDGAVYVTVALNFVVGAVVLACERAGVDVGTPSVPTAAPVSTPGEAKPAGSSDDAELARFAAVIAFVSGLSAVGTQVVWSRLFSSSLEGTIYGVGSVLVGVLIGIGVGSVITGRWLGSRASASTSFVAVQFLLVASLCGFWASVPLLHYILQSLSHGLRGSALIHAQLLVVAASVFVPAATSGAALPILVRVVESRAAGVPQALSRLYAANTAGSVTGSLIGGFIALPMLGTPGTAYAATLLAALVGAVAAVRLLRDQGAQRLAWAGVALLPVLAFPTIDPYRVFVPVGPGQSYWAHDASVPLASQRVIYFEEGRVASVAVTEDVSGKSRGVSLNGLGQGGYQRDPPHHVAESLLVALVPMSHAPRLDSALVVGLGAGTTIDALVRGGVGYVRVVELEPAVQNAAKLALRTDELLLPPRVDVVIDDARHHLLKNRREGKRFDLITSMPAHPWVAASIFTREFFDLARDNLAPDGVFSTWFGMTRMDETVFRSLYGAFAEAFPDHIVYEIPEVGALFLVGSPRPIVFDRQRFARAAVDELVSSHSLAFADTTFFSARVLASGSSAAKRHMPIQNTDDNMIAELRAPFLRTSTVAMSAESWAEAAGLDPKLIPAEQRDEVMTDTLESLLGTPDGVLPLVPAQPRLSRARAALERFRAELAAEAAGYFDGRMAALGRPADLRQLDAVAQSGSAWASRSAIFRAVHTTSETERRDRLAELVRRGSAGGDILIRAVPGPASDLAVEQAVVHWSRGDESASTWMLAMANAATATAAPSPRATRELATLAEGLARPEFLDLCSKAARRTGDLDLERLCDSGRQRWRRNESAKAIAAARRAGGDQRFAEALAQIESAHALEPLNLENSGMYLRTAIYARDLAAERRATQRLRLLGVPEGVIEHYRRSAIERPTTEPDATD